MAIENAKQRVKFMFSLKRTRWNLENKSIHKLAETSGLKKKKNNDNLLRPADVFSLWKLPNYKLKCAKKTCWDSFHFSHLASRDKSVVLTGLLKTVVRRHFSLVSYSRFEVVHFSFPIDNIKDVYLLRTLGILARREAWFLSRLLNKCQTFVFVSHFINDEIHKTLTTTIYHHIIY